MKLKSYLLLFVFCLLMAPSLFAQVNVSERSNYKQTASIGVGFKTAYDNGFVKLRDGTILEGKISIYGDSFSRISGVRIRTNTGNKYDFQPRSLIEYGLNNSSVNDTPELFEWSDPLSSPATGFKIVRTGSAEFGYVILKDGSKKEGGLKLKESNGRVQSLEIKDANKEKFKYDSELVSNYGVQEYEDEKFTNLWSLIKWKKTTFKSDLVSTKSEYLPGYIILTNGQKQEGDIQVMKNETMITQVGVRSSSDAKPVKYKYKEIQEYGSTLTKESYYKYLTKRKPLESFPPKMKFHSGTILMVDGSLIEADLAFTKKNKYGDVFYLDPESGQLVGVKSEDIEEVNQVIPQDELDEFEQYVYDRTHIKGYLIQKPTKYDFKMIRGGESEGIYETRPQFGFVKLKTGREIVGSLYVKKNGTPKSMIRAFISEGNGSTEKFAYKEMENFGLLDHEATTASRKKLMDGTRKGFVVLLKDQRKVEGMLAIEKGKRDAGSKLIFNLGDGVSYKEMDVESYELVDLPVNDLTNNGTIYYEDEKRNFYPGSFTIDGMSKMGWIAWIKPVKKGAYDAFYFADSKDGVANVYYVSKGATDVVQSIEEEFESYDPADDSFLMSKTIETDIQSNGYVITTDGTRIVGQVEMSFPPKLWFATDVTVTQEDGTVTEYAGDGGIQQIMITVDGQEKEFVYFDGVYSEVLDHEGGWVHFRNPHPTTPTGLSNWLNVFTQAALTSSQDYLDEKVAEVAAVQAMKGNDDAAKAAADFLNREKTDYTSYDQFTLYAKEHIIMDMKNSRYAMYIPGKNYQLIEGDLMGSIIYLMMDSDAKKGLMKMNNPSETLKFLDSNL